MKRIVTLVVSLAWAGPSVASDYDLVEVDRRPTSNWAPAVVIGDVTGDGLDDVVVGTGSSRVSPDVDIRFLVYSQKADGSLAEPLKIKYAEGVDIKDIEIGDVDNDGIMDIVASHYQGFAVLRADGGGGFVTNTITASIRGDNTSLKLLDVNFDGNLDIIAPGTVLFGDGRGGVAAEKFVAIPISAGTAVGDATGDGRSDLVVPDFTHFYVHPHSGVNGFGEPILYANPPSSWSPSTAAIGDFNGDGWNDVAMNIPANTPESAIWLYPGLSTGVSDTPVRFSSFDIPQALISADLDHDGRDDLLVGHHAWNAVGRYMQGESGLESEALTSTTFYGGTRALAVGDWNDDGCTDAAIIDDYVGLILLEGRNCAPVEAANDFNGDGRSDLFWHHAGTGANVIWSGADYREQQPVARVTNPSWQVEGHGDFDGDGRADVLWHNVVTGASAIWRSGDFATQQPVTRVTNLDWMIAGIGDFDDDGKDDLLWRNPRSGQNVIWKAGDYRDQQPVAAVTDPRWTVVAVDDFNGDRKDDILWRNMASGRNVIWRSGNYRDPQPVTAVSDRDWQVAGTGDFNGDDLADILWRHARRGTNAIWNAADVDDQSLVEDMDGDWVVAAIGDHDGNRNAEIVWRNRVTGENRIWRAMNATLEFPVTDVGNPAWRVMP